MEVLWSNIRAMLRLACEWAALDACNVAVA